MAIVRNISGDTRTLFRPDAPPVDPDDEVTLRDDNFVGRAWPKSTWALVKPPEGYVDHSTDDAHLFGPEVETKAPAKKKGDES